MLENNRWLPVLDRLSCGCLAAVALCLVCAACLAAPPASAAQSSAASASRGIEVGTTDASAVPDVPYEAAAVDDEAGDLAAPELPVADDDGAADDAVAGPAAGDIAPAVADGAAAEAPLVAAGAVEGVAAAAELPVATETGVPDGIVGQEDDRTAKSAAASSESDDSSTPQDAARADAASALDAASAVAGTTTGAKSETVSGTTTGTTTGSTTSVKVAASPVAPAALKVSAAAKGVSIKWNKVAGASGYRVYRYNGKAQKWIAVKTLVGASARSWKDAAANSNGVTYKYRVRAYGTKAKGGKRWGAKSAVASCYRLARPNVTTRNAVSCGLIKWDRNAKATGYRVYRFIAKTGKWTALFTASRNTVLSYKDVKAKKNGAAYRYRVRSYRKVQGVKSWSARSEVQTLRRLSRPTISSAKSKAARAITVRWGGNAKATGYQIQYSRSRTFASGKVGTVTVGGASTVACKLSKLSGGKKYYVRVRACKTAKGTTSRSAWSVVKSAKTMTKAEAARLAIAKLAAAVACTWWPTDASRVDDTDGNPWTWNSDTTRIGKYKNLGTAVRAATNSNPHNNWAWASCHQAAATIIRAVADQYMWMDGPDHCKLYFEANPDKWKFVGTVSRIDDPLLKPGDVLNILSPFKHTCIYVGHDIARKYHADCDGVIWEASYNSTGARYPGITDTGAGGSLYYTYNVYRYIGSGDGCVKVSDYLK